MKLILHNYKYAGDRLQQIYIEYVPGGKHNVALHADVSPRLWVSQNKSCTQVCIPGKDSHPAPLISEEILLKS